MRSPRFRDYSTSRHVGVYKPLSNATGVYSQLSHYSLWVDPLNSQQSSVSAWVMLRSTAYTFSYAQVGWVEQPYGARNLFSETWDSVGNRQFSFHGSAPAIGTLGYYKVEYSSGNLYYYVGATLVRSHSTWFTPNQAEVAAENHSYDDQMPGAYYTRMHFYDTRNRVSGGSYLAFDGYVFNSDASQYLLQGLSMYNFDVWDSACLY